MSILLGTGTRILDKGGGEDARAPPNHESPKQRANEIVQLENQLPGKESSAAEEIGISTVRECQEPCQEAIVLRQYMVEVCGSFA